MSKHSVIHLLTSSVCFSCEQNNIVNLILQHSGAWVRGVKPRKSCFAVSASLHASLNVQPVIHHLANKQRNQFKLKKNSRAFNTMQGTNAKRGRYKTWAGSTLSHRENHQFYYVVSNKFGFIVVAFCVCLIESLPVSLSALGRDVWSSWSDFERTTIECFLLRKRHAVLLPKITVTFRT